VGEIAWNRQGGKFTDGCFACGRDIPPYKTFSEGGVTRSFHACDADHPGMAHADWWTDWKGSAVLERMMIFDPSKGDGGTTWSALPITPEIIEAIRRLPATPGP
jgi:hypothetical protein